MKRIFGSAIFLLLAAGLSSATALTYYTAVDAGVATAVGTNTSNEFNTFTGALAGFNASTDIDTFESLALGTVNGSLGTAHGVTITASCTGCDTTVDSGSNLISGIVNDGDTHNGYNTTPSGSQFYRVGGAEVSGTSQTSVLTLSFSGLGIQAFGIEVTDALTYFGTTTVTFNDGSPESLALVTSGSSTGCPLSCPADGDQFFGFTTSGLVTSITFTTVQSHPDNTAERDLYGIDQLVIGTQASVPEPATFGLIGAALVGLAGYGYRRRRV